MNMLKLLALLTITCCSAMTTKVNSVNTSKITKNQICSKKICDICHTLKVMDAFGNMNEARFCKKVLYTPKCCESYLLYSLGHNF